MKHQRQAKLMELVSANEIETQEELLRLLREEGFDATQSTVSRDIHELRLYKILSDKGAYRYAPPPPEQAAFSARLSTIFRESVVEIDTAMNLVIIKTLPGMAQAACAALDASPDSMAAGTLAGDDTAFVAMRSEAAAERMAEQLRVVLK